MTEESEQDKLSRECRALYDELVRRGLIEGAYAEWLEAAARQATAEPEKPRIQVVRG